MEDLTTGSRKVLGGALLLAGAALLNSSAAAEKMAMYRPAQGLSHVFGSKHAVGYFLQKDGACAIDLFLAEHTGEEPGPSASRVQFKVEPGEAFKLGSAEGQILEVKCGANASTLEVKAGGAPAKYFSR
jgi:hypothetical protein